MSTRVLGTVRPAFRAIVEAVVPEATRLDEPGWAEVETIVEDALAARPRALRRQLVLFVQALDFVAAVRHGRRLARLEPARRVRFLEAVQNAPFLLLRRGIWGLRTLAFMGYYARSGAAAEIGYRAAARGWLARADALAGHPQEATP